MTLDDLHGLFAKHLLVNGRYHDTAHGRWLAERAGIRACGKPIKFKSEAAR